jgi:hypothetical protein
MGHGPIIARRRIERRLSAPKYYKLEGFSVKRLMHFATALEHDGVIEIRPRAKAAKLRRGGF